MIKFTGTVYPAMVRGEWYMKANYTDSNGNRRQAARKVTSTRSEAKARVINAIEKSLNKVPDRPNIGSFKDFAEYYRTNHAIPAQFVDDVKVAGKKTWKKIRYDIVYLEAFFKNKALDRISRDDIQRYKLYRLNQPVKRNGKLQQRKLAGVHHELRTLRAMLNVALENDWIEKLPNFKGMISQAAETKREKIPTEDEFGRILEAAGNVRNSHFVVPFILLLADTGARPVELYNLTWNNVDLAGKRVILTSDKGKRRTRRTIGLTDRVTKALYTLDSQEALVFSGIKSFRKSWETIRKISGVEIQMYSLRHLFRSRLEQLGLPLMTAMKLLGHSTVEMSQRYTHLQDSDIEAVTSALNEKPYLPVQDLGEV